MNPQKQSAASTNNKKSLSQTGHFVYSSELPNPQNCKYISFYDTTAFRSPRLYRYHVCRVIGMSAFCAEEPHHPSTCTGRREAPSCPVAVETSAYGHGAHELFLSEANFLAGLSIPWTAPEILACRSGG